MKPPAFADVYEAEVWRVYGFFAYRLPGKSDCEDLTQATFERALRAWGRFDPSRSEPGTWLLSIARNLLIDQYRRRREFAAGGAEEVDERSAEDEPALGGVSPELHEGLAALNARERELIALRFGGDLSGPEIAEVTGLSVANVQQILSRSLRRLRAHLDEAGYPARVG